MPLSSKKLVSRVDYEPKSHLSNNTFEAKPSTNIYGNNNPFIPNCNYLVFTFTLTVRKEFIPLLILVESEANENTISKSLVDNYNIPVSSDSLSGTVECGGKTSTILGITKPLRISFKDDSFSIRFIITDDESLPPIIGKRWLKSHRAVIDFDCENLYFKQKDIIKSDINKDCSNITKNKPVINLSVPKNNITSPTTTPPSNTYFYLIDNSNSQNESKPIILNDTSNSSGKSHKLPSSSPKRGSTLSSFSQKFV